MPSNIEDVIGDIEDVKRDLRQNVLHDMRDAMSDLLDTAVTQVKQDSDWTGNLRNSLRAHGVDVEWGDDDHIEFTVGTDENIAPYAPIVEFGSGARTEGRGPGAVKPQRPDQYPADFPYEAPDVEPSKLVGVIHEWVETKPINPQKGDNWSTAMAITKAIIEKGTYAHPFLRPAWFKHKLKVKRSARTAVKKSFR